MTVYIDVLVFDNMLLNSVILMSVASYMKKGKTIFLILSAAIGTAYSVLMVLLPSASVLNLWPLKVILSVLMVVVAFQPRSLKEFIKLLVCFYIITFIFAGLAIALIFLWGQTPASYNGIMYFSWSSPVKYLLVVAIIGISLVRFFLRTMQKKKMVQSQIVDLSICVNDNSCRVPALIDTGNELKDPVSGNAVIVAELSALKSILPESLIVAFEKESCSIDNMSDFFTDANFAERFRLVPFRSLGCEHGMLPGIKSDYVVINDSLSETESKLCKHENVIVCLSSQSLSPDKNYHALIGTDFNINY